MVRSIAQITIFTFLKRCLLLAQQFKIKMYVNNLKIDRLKQFSLREI